MARTIEEYQRDYQKARTAGNAAGMQAANDGANAIRKQQGQAQQVANADIAKFRGVTSTGQQTQPTATALRGSADGVTVASDRDQQIRDQMNANSNKWQGASQEERERLHNENIELSKQLGGGVSFNPGSGTWTGSSGGSVSTERPSSPVSDNSDYLAELYAAQKKAALSQLQSAYDKNKNAFDRAQEGIAPAYQDARNQAAGQSAQAKRSFAEFAAASGLNSGAGGQAELAQNVTLQNNLSQINTAESAKIAELELKRSDAETDYNNAIAQANANNDFELAKSLYAEKVRVDEAWREQIRYESQQDQIKWENNRTLDRDKVSDTQQAWENNRTEGRDTVSDNRYSDDKKLQDFETALSLAKLGDFSKLDAMGADTSALKEQFATQAKASAYKTTGAQNAGMTAQQALAAFNSGLDTPQIRDAIVPVYGNIFDKGKADNADDGGNQAADKNSLPFSDAARAISIQLSNPFLQNSLKPGIIEAAYKEQKISAAEADKLLKSIGA